MIKLKLYFFLNINIIGLGFFERIRIRYWSCLTGVYFQCVLWIYEKIKSGYVGVKKKYGTRNRVEKGWFNVSGFPSTLVYHRVYPTDGSYKSFLLNTKMLLVEAFTSANTTPSSLLIHKNLRYTWLTCRR